MGLRIRMMFLFLALGFFLAAAPAQAQEDWSVSMIAYLWGSGLDGNISAAGRSVEIDQSFSDILSNLEFGFAGGLRAHKNRWAITGDFVYMGLGASQELPNGVSVDVDVDQMLVEGDLGYQVAPSVEVFGGLRINSLQNKIHLPNVEAEADKTWVDPVVGLRVAPRLSETVSWWTRFDVGGFGVGSDFTWQLNTNIVWQFSDRMALAAGYRVIDVKYDDEEGNQEFVYDATSHGPIAGLAFTF